MRKEPRHFSIGDFGKAMIGSLIMGLMFLFKGSMLDYAIKMKALNVILVIMAAAIIVTIEIYALSYRFVTDRKQRPFREFWAKRFFAITISSFLMIYFLIYLYGLDSYLSQAEMLKLASAIFFPAAIAGATIEMLKKKL